MIRKALSFVACLLVILSFIRISLYDTHAADGKVQILYFYSSTCIECAATKEQVIDKMQQKYQTDLEIKFLEITDIKNFEMLLNIEKAYQSPIDKTPPVIVAGKDVLEGKTVIQEQLDKVIQNYLAAGGCVWPQVSISPEEDQYALVAQKYNKITLLAVVGAGLLDGLNPCAFSTLIFLISYLALVGRRKRELIFSGVSFTFGVFVAYFMVGLGLLEILNKIPFFTTAGRYFSYIMAGILVILSMISLYDYFQIRRGKIKEIKLQLGDYFKRKIHGVIREKSRSNTVLIASFVMGFLVSLWEFPCTGQIYFPIIFTLRQISSLRLSAFFYLLLYNIMFILPLIAVFGIAYWGITSEKLTVLMLKHAGKIKLLTVFLLLGLAFLIVFIQLEFAG